jgi:hypothetical protein
MVGFWFVLGLSKLEVALKNTLFFIRFHFSLFFFTLFFLRFLIFFLQFHREEQKFGIGMDGGLAINGNAAESVKLDSPYETGSMSTLPSSFSSMSARRVLSGTGLPGPQIDPSLFRGQ